MRLCNCSQSLSWSWLSGQPPRHGLRKGVLCVVCVRDQTHQAGLLPARHTLSFRLLPAGFAVGSVKLYRLKTPGFSSALCTQQESSVSQNKFTKFLSDIFTWLEFNKLGQFLRMNLVIICATVLFYPYPAFGRIFILKYGHKPLFGAFKCNVSSDFWRYQVICIEVTHTVSCRNFLTEEDSEQSHVTRCQQVPKRTCDLLRLRAFEV